MTLPRGHQVCSHRCELPVPVELDPAGLCVYHFTSSVERTCSEIHRQIALRGATSERQAEVGTYIGACSLRGSAAICAYRTNSKDASSAHSSP
jgi:hypothetical protein